MRRILVIMAKAPVVGKVLKCLIPPLKQDEATCLYERFLLDSVERASAIPDTELVIAYAPTGSAAFFREVAPEASRVFLQRGKKDSGRVNNAFEQVIEHNEAVIVMDVDSPTLPAKSIEMAFDALSSDEVDVVLGPVPDGGCYLIGMKALHPALFKDLDRSCPDYIAHVEERCAEMGLGWYRLPEWYRVALPKDLQTLKEDLSGGANHSLARRTRTYVASLSNADERK